MGGIGKTTLARVVYTQMSPHFEGKSFLANIREVSNKCGLVSLQKQLLSQILPDECFNFFNVHEGNAIISNRLSNKKVLVVLDDVDNLQHLKCLVGKHDWFSLGSRIIVTTRDEHLLRSYRIDDVYKPTTLNPTDALRLFNLKAFDSDTMPKYDFIELSKDVVHYANGLPLALEVLGSFLCDRDIIQWRSAIERLKQDSSKEILDTLRISFDGLEEREKNIFLDIACFFNGEKKDLVMKVLDGCEFFPDIGIDVLIKKSLIKVSDDNQYLRMHALLQEMGRKIVEERCVDKPGKHCKLWKERDVHHVTEMIESMIIDNKRESSKTLNLSVDVFSKMKNLRLLRVLGHLNCDDLKYLSNELRLLDWTGYPLTSLPSSFQPDNLVVLLLPYSLIQQLWKGNRPLYKLKIISLEGSQKLIKTPDFTTAPYLEVLIMEGCISLVDVHPSLGLLKRLKLLNLRDCKSLRSLPTKIGMEFLETLILSGCSNLARFPDTDGKMEHLKTLDLSVLELGGNNFTSIAASFTRLSNLEFLGVSNCCELESLPVLPARMRTDWKDYKAYFIATNSYKLAENISAISLLKTYIKAFANSRKRFDVVIPGNEIPEWFSQQRGGSVIEIPLPLNIQNDSQWIGVAFCCIFVNDCGSERRVLGGPTYIYSRNSGQSSSNGSVFQVKNPREVDFSYLFFTRAPTTKDHLSLRYFSREFLYPLSLKDKCETKNLWTMDCSDDDAMCFSYLS
ncbi:hypothetical protein V6Z12_A11G353100 [Gossypium hirsutum]